MGPGVRRALANVAIAFCAALLAGTVAARVGRAGDLARSLDGHSPYDAVAAGGGFDHGDRTARTRPLAPLIVRAVANPESPLRAPLLRAGRFIGGEGSETALAFRATGLAFTALLAWLLCALLDAYATSTPIKAVAVLGAFATTALARVPAYQPVQIDLGACVFLTMALHAIVKGRRWAVAPATVLAVLATEVGLVAVAFGVYRDWRSGRPRWNLLATYAPALVTSVALQLWAVLPAADGPGLAASLGALAPGAGLALLLDPKYVLLAGYGAVTVFGGVSLLVLARALAGRARTGGEREWLVYIGAVLLVSLVAGMGVWSVLAYALPAVTVLFARATSSDDWRPLALGVALATLATQSIWAPMTDLQYLAARAPDLAIAHGVFLEPHASITWVARLGLVAWFVYWMAGGRWDRSLVAYGVVASVLVGTLGDITGLIPVGNGLGWDGGDYARMIERGFVEGTPSTRLRPIVLLINYEVNYRFFFDLLATFRAMNLVYAFLLAVILADLCRRYGATSAATVTLVVNLFLCISVAKMFAFYPVLVDLGAYMFIAASVWAIVTGGRLLIVVTSVLAVLSREFAAVNVLFGIARDLRTGRSLPVIAATYAPAIAAFFWIRRVAASYSRAEELDEPVLSVGPLVTRLLENMEWWSDPIYVMLWFYFLVTLFGGLSLLLLTTRKAWTTCLRTEPEWFAFIVPLVAITALGYLDTWRYSAFLLPALPALWAWGISGVAPHRHTSLYLAVSAATIATQRPWESMNVASYFRDWFPYYLVIKDRATAGAELWPVWRNYVAIAIASLAVLAVVRHRRAGRP